jgi:hypothetical protein
MQILLLRRRRIRLVLLGEVKVFIYGLTSYTLLVLVVVLVLH